MLWRNGSGPVLSQMSASDRIRVGSGERRTARWGRAPCRRLPEDIGGDQGRCRRDRWVATVHVVGSTGHLDESVEVDPRLLARPWPPGTDDPPPKGAIRLSSVAVEHAIVVEDDEAMGIKRFKCTCGETASGLLVELLELWARWHVTRARLTDVITKVETVPERTESMAGAESQFGAQNYWVDVVQLSTP